MLKTPVESPREAVAPIHAALGKIKARREVENNFRATNAATQLRSPFNTKPRKMNETVSHFFDSVVSNDELPRLNQRRSSLHGFN